MTCEIYIITFRTKIFYSNSNTYINEKKLTFSLIWLIQTEKHFTILKSLADKKDLRFLSMGMSADYKKALIFGATHIRIGTLLFGGR